LIENLQRKDLNVWEEADGLASLCQRFGYTHEDVARRIGKSRSTVTESLTIASLPPNIREKCFQAKINAKSSVLQIARQFDEQAMLDAIAVFENSQKVSLKAAGAISAESSQSEKNNDGNHSQANLQGELTNQDLPSQPQKNGFARLTKPQSDAHGHSTDLSSPVRAFTYQPPESDYKLALKFKRPVEKTDIILALRKILAELEQN
jgi:ParB-like chromosome segregation protein Spo0J